MTLAKENVFLLYRDGVSQSEIARQAGVSKQRISQIVTSVKDEIARRQHIETIKRYRDNHATFIESLERFSDSQEEYADCLRMFEANYESYRRAFKSLRGDREARRRDGHIRRAYLKAHPRAKRAVRRAAEVLDPPGAAPKAPERAPGQVLRLVR